MTLWSSLLVGLTISLPVWVDENVLEPSVQHEVDHALYLGQAALNRSVAPIASGNAPTNGVVVTVPDFLQTNGLSRTAIALRVVSNQKGDGRWLDGTNDVTALAVEILRSF